MRPLLFTECLQNDFVAPVRAGAPLPNALHVGRAESRRLLGDPDGAWVTEGPLARFLAEWGEGGSGLASIHIRDWHDPADPATRAHLEHFGPHCLRGSEGARFVAPLAAVAEARGDGAHVVDSAVLSDFVGTGLESTLASVLAGGGDMRAGIIGVWTDFKVRNLAYDLLTRTSVTEIAVCSALTASRSRIHHRQALEHMASSLGVHVIDSIPGFLAWLGIRGRPSVLVPRGRAVPEVGCAEGVVLSDEERRLVEHLFRDCGRVSLEPLSGGYSGSRVFRSSSLDRSGRREVPFVVKIDVHARVARERVAVESVENLLGAASPRMAEYVDLETLGAIKYHFATMHGGEVRTLQRAVRLAGTPGEVEGLFDNVISRVLSRLYQTPALEALQLFRYYDYQPRYAERTVERAESLAASTRGDALTVEGVDGPLPHPVRFYRRLGEALAQEPVEAACSWVHGDLNLANVLLDGTGNTWLIDYYWTRFGHALQDLAKLENDLKFVMVPLADDASVGRAVAWERELLGQEDLLAPVPAPPGAAAADPGIARAHAAVARLRALASSLLVEAGAAGRVGAHGYRVALLRYSAHTLSFQECDQRQKRYALASTCLLADRVAEGLR